MNNFRQYAKFLCVCWLLTSVSTLNFDKSTEEELVVVKKVDNLLNELLQNILDYVRWKNDTSLDWAHDTRKDANMPWKSAVDNSKVPDVMGSRPIPEDKNVLSNASQAVLPFHHPVCPSAHCVEKDVPSLHSSSQLDNNVSIQFPSPEFIDNTNQLGSVSLGRGTKQLPSVDGSRLPKWLGSSPLARKLYSMVQESISARESTNYKLTKP